MLTVSFDLGLFYFAMFSILSASKSNNTQTVPTVSPNVLMQIRGHCKLTYIHTYIVYLVMQVTEYARLKS